MAQGSNDDYKVELIRLAKEIAVAGTGTVHVSWNQRRQFLEQFRAAYLHMAATVENGGSVLQINPAKAALADTDGLIAIFDQPGEK